MEKQNTINIIYNQVKEIPLKSGGNFGLTIGKINEKDNFKLRATFKGPKDSPYNGGLFLVKIILPEDYPKNPPKIIFLTPIYHLNVKHNINQMSGGELLGEVKANFLKNWKPETTILEILIKLYTIFYKANPESCYGILRAEEYLYNKTLYEEKTKYFTKKYANPLYLNKIKDNEDWNFFYELNEKVPPPNSHKRQEKKMNENDNRIINMSFIYNGKEEIIIQCRMNDTISRVIDNYESKMNFSKKNKLYIIDEKIVNYDNSLVQKYFNNHGKIDVIDIDNIEFY